MKKLLALLIVLTAAAVILGQSTPVPAIPPAALAQAAPGSGINWQEIILICGGVAAVHGLMTKYVVNPALDKFNLVIDKRLSELEKSIDARFLAFRKTIDDEFVRCPERDDELPISRRENTMFEEQAKREHAALKEKIDELAKRLDYEFGKVWGVLKRLVNGDHPGPRTP